MKTVMVVDDSASVRQVSKLTLVRGGYNVVEATDGRDALAKLGAQKVNLIVSDVNMPHMGGLELLTHLKQHTRHKFVPVIMLTTEHENDKKEKGRLGGAKAWIVKPFDPPQLLDAVSKLITA